MRRIFELFLIKRAGKYKLLRALFEIGWLIESGSALILHTPRVRRARAHAQTSPFHSTSSEC
jgi:hypothetical protein